MGKMQQNQENNCSKLQRPCTKIPVKDCQKLKNKFTMCVLCSLSTLQH